MKRNTRNPLTMTSLAAATLLGSLLAASPARAGFCDATQTATPTAVGQWRRWEKELPTLTNYLKVDNVDNKGNPYRDVVLRVTYTNCTTGATLSTYGFWEKAQTFKIRSAFPPPSQSSASTEDWQWQTTCSRRNGGIGPDCFADGALHNKLGRIRVSRSSSGGPLYKNGFLKVSSSARYLVHDNGTKFFWLGDTAWTLPVEPGSATRTDVLSYFAKRGAADGNLPSFTVVQMAPAAQWGRPTPAFEAAVGCGSSTALPNACSRWLPDYWTNFDNLVEKANQNGLVVAIVGVMEPLNLGSYPTIEDAKIFARNLIAREYGNFVVYSPGFDSDVASNGALIKAVGAAIREASSRHLIVNHNAGRSPVSEIESLHGETWLNFQLFQSGKSAEKIPGSGIPTSIPNSDKVAIQLYNMMDRAISIPTALAKKTPLKPSANGETAYEKLIPNISPVNFTPARIRQTAYLSMLSGAFGYTYGHCWYAAWGATSPGGCPTSNATNEAGTPGARQTRILRSIFQSFNWEQLKPEPARIQNQAAADHPESKLVLARDATSNAPAIVAYLPHGQPQIDIDFNARTTAVAYPAVPGLAGATCFPNNWTVTWLSPRTGAAKGSPSNGIVKLANGKYRFKKPTCDGGCDANDNLLRLSRIATTGTCAQGATFQTWSSPSADLDERLTLAGLVDPEDETTVEAGLPVGPALDPEGTSPQGATNAGGISVVVWQSLNETETPRVLARSYDEQGLPLSEVIELGAGLFGPKIHPAIAALANDSFLVTYVAAVDETSTLQIYVETVDGSLSTLSGPIAMHCSGLGDFPLVTADPAGGAVIAWNVPKSAEIDAQRVDDWGYPYDNLFQVAVGDSIALSGLEITAEGEALAYWEAWDSETGESTGDSAVESLWGASSFPLSLCR